MIKAGRVKLLKIGAEVTVEVPSTNPKTGKTTLRRVELNAGRVNLKEEDFKRAERELKARYPKLGYRFRRWKGFWILTRRGGLPVYYSPKDGTLYVPSTFATRKKKELRKGLPYRLKSLGVPFRLAVV